MVTQYACRFCAVSIVTILIMNGCLNERLRESGEDGVDVEAKSDNVDRYNIYYLHKSDDTARSMVRELRLVSDVITKQ